MSAVSKNEAAKMTMTKPKIEGLPTLVPRQIKNPPSRARTTPIPATFPTASGFFMGVCCSLMATRMKHDGSARGIFAEIDPTPTPHIRRSSG